MNDLHAKQTVLWLIVCATWVVIPYLFYLPPWALIPFFVMAGWRYMIHSHGWRSPGRAVKLSLATLAMLVIYQHYQTIFGRDAGLTFLLLLMGLKFSELNTSRDRVLLVYILFLLLLGNFLFDQSLWVAGYLFVAVIACLGALVQIQQPSGTSVKKRLQVSGTIMATAIPLMLVMYFLFPRLSFGLWGFYNQSTTSSGFSEELRPGDFSRLIESTNPVFRVQFNGDPPPANLQYWRGAVLNETDGRKWFDNKSLPPENDSVINGTRTLTYEVTLEPNRQGWLFPLDLPAAVQDRGIIREGLTLRARRVFSDRKRFQIKSYLAYQTSKPENPDRYLKLPANISKRVLSLARSWRYKKSEDYAIAIVTQALQMFARQEFYYTLQPPLLGGDPVDEFLFETKKGYCEHYASAFVTLMRAAGVPARVVVGYQGGEYNPVGKYLTVRQSDAHAWAEYLHPDHGWVRVDPTAAVAPSRIEFGMDSLRALANKGLDLGSLPSLALKNSLGPDWLRGFASNIRLRWDALNFAWYRWVEDFGPQRQAALLKALGLLNTGWVLRLVIMAALVILLLAVFFAFYFRKETTRDKTLKLYLLFCKKLSRRGFARRTTEGPVAFANRVTAAKPEWSGAIKKVTDSYVALRYGDTRMTLKNLRIAVEQFRPV